MSLVDCIQALNHRNLTNELVFLDFQTADTVMNSVYFSKFFLRRSKVDFNLKSTSSYSCTDENPQNKAEELVKVLQPKHSVPCLKVQRWYVMYPTYLIPIHNPCQGLIFIVRRSCRPCARLQRAVVRGRRIIWGRDAIWSAVRRWRRLENSLVILINLLLKFRFQLFKLRNNISQSLHFREKKK